MILLAALGFDNDEIAARPDTRRYVFTGGCKPASAGFVEVSRRSL